MKRICLAIVSTLSLNVLPVSANDAVRDLPVEDIFAEQAPSVLGVRLGETMDSIKTNDAIEAGGYYAEPDRNSFQFSANGKDFKIAYDASLVFELPAGSPGRDRVAYQFGTEATGSRVNKITRIRNVPEASEIKKDTILKAMETALGKPSFSSRGDYTYVWIDGRKVEMTENDMFLRHEDGSLLAKAQNCIMNDWYQKGRVYPLDVAVNATMRELSLGDESCTAVGFVTVNRGHREDLSSGFRVDLYDLKRMRVDAQRIVAEFKKSAEETRVEGAALSQF